MRPFGFNHTPQSHQLFRQQKVWQTSSGAVFGEPRHDKPNRHRNGVHHHLPSSMSKEQDQQQEHRQEHRQERFGFVWLHGLGGTGEEFSFLPPQMAQHLRHYMVWCMPTAPVRDWHGSPATAWYAGGPRVEHDSISIVHREIDDFEATCGIPAHRVFVGGFSQGGAMALSSVYLSEKKVAGAVCLSGWLSGRVKAKILPTNLTTPAFWGHGMLDRGVKFSNFPEGVQFLRESGRPVDAIAYKGMKHTISDDEWLHVAAFINRAMDEIIESEKALIGSS